MTKPKVLLVVLLLLSLPAYSQISDYLESGNFEWTYWEAIDEAEKPTFLTNAGLTSLSPNSVRIVDIDGDQNSDVISMPSPNKVILMLNVNSSFKTILDLDETLVMIGRPKPWHPVYLLTKDENCCGKGQYALNYYRPGFDQNKALIFTLDKSIVIQNDVEIISENLPPFKAELKSDLSLQAKPDPGSAELGKYTTGSIGFAVASKKGSDERIWWLILMPLEAHSLKAGWMPSTELKRKFR